MRLTKNYKTEIDDHSHEYLYKCQMNKMNEMYYGIQTTVLFNHYFQQTGSYL